MKIKLTLNDKERDVKIKGIKKKYRNEYYDRLLELEKIDDDESLSTKEKLNTADKFITWLEDLGVEHSDLSKEEKEELDLEDLKIISETVREVLQPISDKKKS